MSVLDYSPLHRAVGIRKERIKRERERERELDVGRNRNSLVCIALCKEMCCLTHYLSKCIEMSFTESTTALAYHTPNKRLQVEVE